jgi:hypothetical protein
MKRMEDSTHDVRPTWKWDRRSAGLSRHEKDFLETLVSEHNGKSGTVVSRARRDRAKFLLLLNATHCVSVLRQSVKITAPTVRKWKSEFFELAGDRRVIAFVEKARACQGGKPRLPEDMVLLAWRRVVEQHGRRVRVRHIEEACDCTTPTLYRILKRHNITKDNLWGASLSAETRLKIAEGGLD